MTEARSDTGILYEFNGTWLIDSNYRNNHNYINTYILIRNPHSFPHVLIPENIGKEVHYIHSTPDPVLVPGFDFIYFFTLDLVPVYIIKQSILYFCIITIFSVALTYFYLNRKRFQFTNKLLG